MENNKIYLVKNNKFSVLIDKQLKSPNGLIFKNKTLFVENNNYILAFKTETKIANIVCENTGGIDEFKFIKQNDFIIVLERKLLVSIRKFQEQSMRR